jgi:hypothetical protein
MISAEIRELQTDALERAPEVLKKAVDDERRLVLSTAVGVMATDAEQAELAEEAVLTVPYSTHKGIVLAGISAVNRREDEAVRSLDSMGLQSLAQSALRDRPLTKADVSELDIGYDADEMVVPVFEMFPASSVLARSIATIAIGNRWHLPHDLARTAPLLLRHIPDSEDAYNWMAERNIPVHFLHPIQQTELYVHTGNEAFLRLALLTARKELGFERSYHPIVLERVMKKTQPVYKALLNAGMTEAAEAFATEVATHVENMYDTATQRSDAVRRSRAESFYDAFIAEEVDAEIETPVTPEETIKPISEIMAFKNAVSREHLLAKAYGQLSEIFIAEHASEPVVPVSIECTQDHMGTPERKQKRGLAGLFRKK